MYKFLVSALGGWMLALLLMHSASANGPVKDKGEEAFPVSDSMVFRGTVVSPADQPLPYVNVYLKGTTKGTTTNEQGSFTLRLKEREKGVLVFKYVGYEKREIQVSESRTDLRVVMKKEDVALPEVKVTASGRDPAYGIIEKAREKRKYYRDLVESYSARVYMKGQARLEEIPEGDIPLVSSDRMPDSSDKGLIYLSESVSRFHYQEPGQYKEKMLGSKVAGDPQGGFSINRARWWLSYDLYENSVDLNVADREFISPIAATSSLYYDYELLGTFKEHGELINKIRVIPKRDRDPVFEGIIYIVEDQWNIHSADLRIAKKAPTEMFIDSAAFKQSYVPVNDSVWMPISLELTYHYKLFGYRARFNAIGRFSGYDVGRDFPRGFFKDEVFRVSQKATERDTNFWTDERSVILTSEERRNYREKDSLARIRRTEWYRDSVDSVENRPSFGDLFLGGYTHENTFDSLAWGLNTVTDMIRLNTVEGWTVDLAPYYRDYSDPEFEFEISGHLRYGTLSDRFSGRAESKLEYDPFSSASVSIEGGSYPVQINGNNPISPFVNSLYTLIREENFLKLYRRNWLSVHHRREYLNGLFLGTGLSWNQRVALRNASKFRSPGKDPAVQWTPNRFFSPSGIIPEKALVLEGRVEYTPRMEYELYPNRKRSLGSDWPTFFLDYRKALEIDGDHAAYDKVQTGFRDRVALGLLGRSDYRVIGGKFLNKEKAAFYDRFHFNGNRTLFLRQGERMFRTMDYYSRSTFSPFAAVHYEHHFNGFFFNKLPILRNTRFQTVIGANLLFRDELSDHREVFVGLENILQWIRVELASPYKPGEGFDPSFRIGIDQNF